MAPVLPVSLSPHVCILTSPDLDNLLASSSLPPLPQVLQSFSPLPNVTTRTTALTSVTHPSFNIRFSDLVEIETSCKEDEEHRASRTIDWIGSRIAHRCGKWVDDMEKMKVGEQTSRTPWWDELKRCAEGDHVPSRTEGWNHPVTIILAVSTTAPNPLQAITALHARQLDLPPWVDPTYLRYTLIIHPQNSPLNDEEAGALFNAIKKQYGFNTYLLPLALPNPPPPPIPVPALAPRLPPPPPPDAGLTPPSHLFSAPGSPNPNGMTNSLSSQTDGATNAPPGAEEDSKTAGRSLKLSEVDIQQTAKFMREFVVTRLVPWMEKCVIEWNENFTSTRRLPSRLFSSTRRLFGSSAPSSGASTPPPGHAHNPSVSSVTSRSSMSSLRGYSTAGDYGAPISQQRRLAEFATVLGDVKLAISVWESLRKDGKGGSDILPLLLSASPAVSLYASHALETLHPPSLDPPSYVQHRALIYAVRWVVGIPTQDFLSKQLEGERWLVSAAGAVEEPHAALLLAHAALLSARKLARRRAALWYLFAANKLEKCGIRPLTMYFLRRSHELYKLRPDKSLSPSFWDSGDRKPTEWEGFDAVLPGIEHALGRLLYTTGDVEGALKLFLDLLRRTLTSHVLAPPPLAPPTGNGATDGKEGTDRVFLEDFRVAFKHFISTSGDQSRIAELKLPFTFCVTRRTRIRLPRHGVNDQKAIWEQREGDWKIFWRTRGKERLEESGKAAVDESFWVDLLLSNPLDVEVSLSNLTVAVREQSSDVEAADFVETETIDDIVLGPKDARTIPVYVKAARPASLIISDLKYDFLSLLPASESLASRGKRLHDTPAQKQTKTYSPDVPVKVQVEDASQRLEVSFVEDGQLVLAHGECKRMSLWLRNSGTRDISELWMVTGTEDDVWVDVAGSLIPESSKASQTEVLVSRNSIMPPRPYRIPIEKLHDSSSLGPGQQCELPIILHGAHISINDLSILFVFREQEGQSFRSARVTRSYEVKPMFRVTVESRPSRSLDKLFLLNLELDNVFPNTDIHLNQVSTVSATWSCTPIRPESLGHIGPSQLSHVSFGVQRRDAPESSAEDTSSFTAQKLRDVLHGRGVESSQPPPLNLLCTHVAAGDGFCLNDAVTNYFVRREKRSAVARSTVAAHPYIPPALHPFVFPLYNPSSIDIVLFWTIPSEKRSGHILVNSTNLGVGHAALKEIIEEAENLKVKRSMYAETQRQKHEVLEAIRVSEWNAEMNPVVVAVQDGRKIEHDFSDGPCSVPVELIIRNYSLTNPSRFVLKLNSAQPVYPPSSSLLPPHYSGRLTHRGTLSPSEQVTVRAKIWVDRPGAYALNGWRVETEVGEKATEEDTDANVWRTRHRYAQSASSVDSCIIVTDRRPT